MRPYLPETSHDMRRQRHATLRCCLKYRARPVRIAAYDFRGSNEDDRWNLASTEPFETDWSAVTARCLAYLCLQHSDVQDKGLFERATFLMNLGLPRSDAAALLGSTDESLRVTLRGKPAKKARSKKQDK